MCVCVSVYVFKDSLDETNIPIYTGSMLGTLYIYVCVCVCVRERERER